MQYTINNNNIIITWAIQCIMLCQTIVLLLGTLRSLQYQHPMGFTVSRVLSEHRCALKNGDVAASAIV